MEDWYFILWGETYMTNVLCVTGYMSITKTGLNYIFKTLNLVKHCIKNGKIGIKNQ